MDIRRALDIIYDYLELDEDNEVGEAWQTLEDYCTQPMDVQQLKDTIATLSVELEQAVYPDFSPIETRKVLTKMLLLSGRNKYNVATASI